MTDPRILASLDLAPDATGEQIARRLRALARLPEDVAAGAPLWIRFVDGVEIACTMQDPPRGDPAELANYVVDYAIVEAGIPVRRCSGTGRGTGSSRSARTRPTSSCASS
jgi:hypothetical protein